ncbi:hypothetical protein NLM27_33880 [Bradyrhizobium sp. CCGB12]|uniref:hypothetical protein n=1 Tax=Bradyrhizobium sp. CCGB12 TaxID=2949632 RepID=UPI0020B38C7A|nr:hypothetical protein [Bradyrhizobium sp. CCGB12]MCP3393752.1 hypothetical protein [Bradyrhizobium sp. CCGB12]
MVTHKTNIAYAFGKDAGDVQEGEAFVYKGQRLRAPFGGPIKLADWNAKASNDHWPGTTERLANT